MIPIPWPSLVPLPNGPYGSPSQVISMPQNAATGTGTTSNHLPGNLHVSSFTRAYQDVMSMESFYNSPIYNFSIQLGQPFFENMALNLGLSEQSALMITKEIINVFKTKLRVSVSSIIRYPNLVRLDPSEDSLYIQRAVSYLVQTGVLNNSRDLLTLNSIDQTNES